MTEKLQKILCFLKNHREFLFEKTKIMLVVSFFLLGVFACAEMYSAVLLSHRIMIDRGIEAKFPSREFFKELIILRLRLLMKITAMKKTILQWGMKSSTESLSG